MKNITIIHFLQWKSPSAVVLSHQNPQFRSILAVLLVNGAYFSPDSDKMTFSLEKSVLCIEDSIGEVKNILMDLFLTKRQLFTSQDINWWTGVVWIRGLHWVWAPAGPKANLAGAGGFTFAAGRSERSENFAGDPRGTVGFAV